MRLWSRRPVEPDRRAASEAAYDALEKEASPDDLVDFYLERLGVVTAHLADAVEFLCQQTSASAMDDRDMATYMDVCIERIDRRTTSVDSGAPWRMAWEEFKFTFDTLRHRSLKTPVIRVAAPLLFVAVVVIRRLHAKQPTLMVEGNDVAFEHHAASAPHPIAGELSLQEQFNRLFANFEAVYLQMPDPYSEFE